MKGHGLLLLLLLHAAVRDAGSQQQAEQYYCIENYKAVGDLIRTVDVSSRANGTDPAAHVTSGHTARRCSVACDAEPACTAFRAIGADAVQGPQCQLLSRSTASLPSALALPPGADWPPVMADLMPGDGFELRSLAWLCFKGAEEWDAFGRASHALIMTGQADPTQPEFGYTPWCAIGLDVAGANQQQVTNISSPADCDRVCSSAPDACQMYTFVAAKPGSGQAPLNCFTKIDAFRGQNGWTGPPKADIWQPDSQMDCFARLSDWRQLGLILSPSIETVPLGSSYFTVFPERVTWQQANASCSQLPGGRLAVLDSRQALDTVYRSLLTTLPSQTAVRSAWVGAVGSNTNYRPGSGDAAAGSNAAAIPAGTNSSSRLFQGQAVPSAQPRGPRNATEDTLTWLDGQRVESYELRRLEALPAIWSVHDVIWAQQVVPANASSVCGRILVQTASPQEPLLDPAAVLPGVWYFDCNKPAAFICESTSPPLEPMAGRTVVFDDLVQNPHWSGNGSTLAPWKVALATLLPTLAVLLFAWQWLHLRANRASRLPDLLWQQKKRLAGAPRWGAVSVVVTDIQDFTRLTQEAPQAMAQALVLHNQVVLQAAYDHVGSVVLQEGDSYTLAFHEPQDAVEFALQVQQALQQQAWPAGLHYPDPLQHLSTAAATDGDSTPASPAGVTAARTSSHQQQQQQQQLSPTRRASLDQGLLRWLSSTMSAAVGGAGGSDRRLSDSSTNVLDSTPQTSQVSGSRADVLQGLPNSAAAQAAAAGAGARAHPRWRLGHRGRQSLDSSPYSYITTRDASPYSPSWIASNPFSSSSIAGTRQRNAWLQQLLSPGRYQGTAGRGGERPGSQQQLQEQQERMVRGLFRGLRVRMGVASGHVPKGQELRRSQVYRMAQDVSSAATGGQVLLDQPTFTAVKESMRRLGLITAAGLDYEALYASGSSRKGRRRGGGSSRDAASGGSEGSGRSGWVSTASGRLSALLPGKHRRAEPAEPVLPTSAPAEYAVAFDMGCYELLPSTGTTLQQHHQHSQDLQHPVTPGHTSSAGQGSGAGRSSTIPLWGDELGGLLLEQHQAYLQRLLQQEPSAPARMRGRGLGADDSFSQQAEFASLAGESFAAAGAGDAAGLHGSITGSVVGAGGGVEQPYTLATYLRQLSVTGATSPAASEAQQQQHLQGLQGPTPGQPHHHQHHQQQHHHHHHQQQQQHKAGPGGWVQGGVRRLTHGLLGVGSLPQHQLDPGHSSSLSSRAPSSNSSSSTPNSTDAAAAAVWQATRAAPTVRLYQIVSPALPGRAAVFGSHLALPDTWHCIDPPYFDAPGVSTLTAAARPLASAAAATAGELPPAPAAAGAGASVVEAAYEPQQPHQLPPLQQPHQSPPPPPLQQQQLRQQQEGEGVSAMGAAAGAQQAVAAAGCAVQEPAGVPAAPSTPVPAALRGPSSHSPFAAAAIAAPAEPQTPHAGTAPAETDQQQQQQPQHEASDSRALPPVLASGPATVSVVFVSVDGAHQLAAHPELARCLHHVLHRLMLQLLSSHFPGSYLIRAQEGELRYLAAFTSPTAAAAWCITLHEAALYAPYPHELLRIPGFGVQLDGRGRLVFRGPRLKAGFSEGTPNCILPDHMGRADYSGAFVNRAARFADAAAHGGRIVTDAELAGRVLQCWQQQQQQDQGALQPLPPSPQDSAAPAPHTVAAAPSCSPTAAATVSAVTAATAALSSDVVPSPRVSLRAVFVEVSHLGSYLFKGSPRPVGMVSLSPAPLAGRSYPDEAAPHGKGVRVAQQVGSMGGAAVLLPAAVEQEGYSCVVGG